MVEDMAGCLPPLDSALGEADGLFGGFREWALGTEGAVVLVSCMAVGV